MSLTIKQIDAQLKVLSDYEMSLHHNTWDDFDRISDELLRVLTERLRLQQMRKELSGPLPPESFV